MADQNDHTQGPDHDDLYDDAAPRSIFAATWFRAVLVLIVLGVIGAVAVPYILDAMNAPPPKTAATKPAPAPPIPQAVTPTPAPPPVTAAPTASAPVVSPTPPPPPAMQSSMSDKPVAGGFDKVPDKKESMVAATTTTPEPSKAESTTESKPEPKTEVKPVPKAAPKVKTDAKPAAKAASAPAKAASTSAATKQWYVQIGAFKDADTAKRVATKLRDDNYTVEEWSRGTPTATVAKATTPPPPVSGSSDQYDVIIAGPSPADLGTKLSAKGLSAESTPSGSVVKPSLPLRDAVALSKDLAVDGLKVQVRRAGSAPPAPRAATVTEPASGNGDSLHRVSVGGFADRTTALAALKELEGKGYKPFLTRR